ncbi:hypothetical protein ACSBOX_21645 (plasmid) [Arthrobacter sp. KN11-1C]|uniref:hypothetical protein n=1 Tax=Arthrobacter sp. KN11-1C TaxID=3445774 RepID=UPI003FA128B1
MLDLRGLFRRRPATAGAEESTAGAPTGQDLLTPEQAADVEQAWVELRQAAEEAGVTAFRACTRGGSRWEEDPAAVHALAAALRSFKEADTATGGDPAR